MRYMKWIMIASVGALVWLVSSGLGAILGKHYLQASRPEYTIQFLERVVSSNSSTTKDNRFIVAQRADGSTVRINLDGSGKWVMRSIKLLTERQNIVVSEPIQALSTRYLSPDQIVSALARPPDLTCNTHPEIASDVFKNAGSGVFLGLNIVKNIIETKASKSERWESPECNCQALLETVVWKRSDGSSYGTTETIATSVKLGKPDEAMFAVPVDYKEKSPSVIMSEMAIKMYGQDMPAATLRKLQDSTDLSYYQSRMYRTNK